MQLIFKITSQYKTDPKPDKSQIDLIKQALKECLVDSNFYSAVSGILNQGNIVFDIEEITDFEKQQALIKILEVKTFEQRELFRQKYSFVGHRLTVNEAIFSLSNEMLNHALAEYIK